MWYLIISIPDLCTLTYFNYGKYLFWAIALFDVQECKSSFSLQNGLNDAILPSLLEFICMSEHGAVIKSQLRFGASKTDSAIAQLLNAF